MKKIILAFLIFQSVFYAHAQIAYYDAQFLRSKIDPSQNTIVLLKDVQQLLMNYYPGTIEDDIDTTLLNQNPFFKDYFTPKGVQEVGPGFISSKLSSIGSIDVTNFTKGLSLFLIERAKQEINIAFLDKFKRFIEDEKNKGIEILFPETCRSIENLMTYNYNDMLPQIREAFHTDLTNIPINMIKVYKESENYEKLQAKVPELSILINYIELIHQIDYLTPPQYVEKLPSVFSHDEFKDLKNSFSLLGYLSNSMRTNDSSFVDSLKNYWISHNEIYNKLFNDQIVFEIYLGLIYQQMLNNDFTYGVNYLKELAADNEKREAFKSDLLEFHKILSKSSNAAKKLKTPVSYTVKTSYENISLYLGSFTEAISFGYQFLLRNDTNSSAKSGYINMAVYANNLYSNTVSEKYTLAITDLVNILNEINTLNREYNIADIKSQGKDDKEEKKKIKEIKKSYEINPKLISGISLYGTFMARIVDAENPEDVQAAFDAAALPAGSSSAKKNYSHNIALNAYPGVSFGNWLLEESNSDDSEESDENKNTWNSKYRVTAQIGVAYTPLSMGKGGSVSVFASFLDIGAMVHYQLNGDSTAVDQKIYLANIFSPGLYVLYGLGYNLPLSIGFGVQYGPGLVEYGEALWNPSWRCNVTITFDIPIFNLSKGRERIPK